MEERRGPGRVIVLLVLAVLLVGVGVFCLLRGGSAEGGGGNSAVVDTGTTAEVTGQVRDGLEKIFSYRHDDLAATERTARGLLTGDAVGQYGVLFDQVRRMAPEQRLSLRSSVVSSGVTVLSGDRATLLVFLDQNGIRGDGTPSIAAAQLTVSAQRVDGRWLISGLQPR
ncbi:hypothetical protein [Herbihabitans rhizosphaerae]|uniref:hypothetical protein n=1 Tax=Herbihabitans rhizosphaerae TaxID=1872711 RepID=UPI00102AECB1|nr:hypothetical protein [Herbihabitans rhizosphaerae]